MSRPAAALVALALVAAGALLAASPSRADLAPPPEPERFQVEDGVLKLPVPIAFEAGTAELTPSSRRAVAHIARYLQIKEAVTTLRVEGHVAGEAKEAQALSEKRALAVAKAVVAAGVDCGRLVAVGFGATKPRTAGETPEERALNTRVDAVMAALRGRPIGGMPIDGGGVVAGDVCPAR